MHRPLLAFALLLLGALSGCGSPTPVIDEHFGQAVRFDKQAQYLNPNAGLTASTTPPVGLDGPSAQAVMERYHKSFKAPPPVVNVLNIGGSISGSSSGN